MSAAISMQAGFWLYAAALGAVLLFLYDLLRIFRRVVPHGVASVGIEDFVYWLVSGCLIFAMLYRFNNGIIRWFAVFGMLVGMLFYHLTVSTVFVKYASRLLKRILQFLHRIVRVLDKILRGILRRIRNAARKVGHILSPPFRFVYGKLRALPANMNKRHKKVTNSSKKRLKSGRKEGKMKKEAKKGSDTVGKEQKRPPKRTPQRAPRGKKARQPQQTE